MGLVRGNDCPFDDERTLKGGEVLHRAEHAFAYGFFEKRESGLVLVRALIISRAHHESVGDLPPDTMADMWRSYLWLRHTCGAEAPGRNFVINDDDGNDEVDGIGVAGQTIAHPHGQYIPRYRGRPSSNAGLALLAKKLDAAHDELIALRK